MGTLHETFPYQLFLVDFQTYKLKRYNVYLIPTDIKTLTCIHAVQCENTHSCVELNCSTWSNILVTASKGKNK